MTHVPWQRIGTVWVLIVQRATASSHKAVRSSALVTYHRIARFARSVVGIAVEDKSSTAIVLNPLKFTAPRAGRLRSVDAAIASHLYLPNTV